MDKITLICVLVILTNPSFAQETKEITKENNFPNYKEVYSILTTDKKIKHGKYVSYGRNNKIQEKGEYELGKKIGLWEFYNWDGELEQKYNFTDNKIDWNTSKESKLIIQTEVNGVFVDIKPDQFPVFIGGYYRLTRFVFALKYPVEARRNGTQGTVVISAIITVDGRMIDEKVEFGIGSGCDKEALRVLKEIPDEWISARHNGELRNVKIFYPVKFKLE